MLEEVEGQTRHVPTARAAHEEDRAIGPQLGDHVGPQGRLLDERAGAALEEGIETAALFRMREVELDDVQGRSPRWALVAAAV
jgi:hypothetical protein